MTTAFDIQTLRAYLVQQLEDADVALTEFEVDDVAFDCNHPSYLRMQSINERRNDLAQQINEIDGAETYEIDNLIWYL